MSSAVLKAPAPTPATALQLAPAAARLALRALLGAVLLGLAVLAVGPRLYPFGSFYVRSASMAPTIPVGAMVLTTRAAADDLVVGDVIVFERPDQPGMTVIHRIVAVERTPAGREFVTKGDANGAPDSWRVPATGEGWRAEHSFAGLGFLVGWLDTALSRQGWLGALAAVAGVCALATIWRSEEP